MAVDMALAKKGQKEPRLGIAEQLAVLIALATRFAVKLAEYDWPAEKTQELTAVKAKLESKMAEQAEAKDGKRSAGAAQAGALSKAKALKRNLDRAVRRVFRAEKNLPVNPEAFEVGRRVGDSVPVLLGWFVKVAPAVTALAPKLLKKMGGVEPVAALEAMRAELEKADVKQETSLSALPAETLEVYEAKGRALELIADLIDTAHSAFDDDAAVAAQFNKDIVVRARKARPAPAAAPAIPA